MKDNNVEIIDDNQNTKTDTKSDIVDMPKSVTNLDETQILETKIDKKELKRQEKLRKKEEKKNKKNKNNQLEDEKITSNVYDNTPVTIVETAITKGSSGSEVIGNIDGDNITPTNNPLPSPIDITVKQKVDNKNNTKKVKVVSKKEKIISIIISIFVLIVLGGAGYAAYYFGYKTNPSIYELKNIYLELGDELPNSVSYYIASSNQLDDMEYSLDTSNVAQNIIGSYTYSVTHKNVTKSAQVIVRDTKSPLLTIKDENKLIFQKDSKVTKDDIVLMCEDLSNCTYKTEYDISTETPGEKDVTIIARDDAGNETKEIVSIKIIDIQRTLVCTSQEIEAEDKTYKTATINTLSFDSNDYLVQKSGIKQYTYSDYSAYFAKLNELQNDDRYIFNRMNFTYTESSEVDNNNLTNFNDIVKYYNDIGYTCK